ncbi:MAG: hypothetical protein ABIU58_12920 [Ramlibacter sp.]
MPCTSARLASKSRCNAQACFTAVNAQGGVNGQKITLVTQDDGTALEPSHLALEGYVDARVSVDALARWGRNPTRERFVEATTAGRDVRLIR